MKQEIIKKFRNHTIKVSEFRIQDLFGIAMIFVVTGIAIAYGLSVQEDVSSDMTAGTAAKNAADQSINGTAKLAEKMPMIATIVTAAIIIGVLVTYFVVRGRG